MARGPVATRGASTVVPAASTLAANAKQKVLTAAQTGLQKIFFTSADLQDPNRLYQVISKLRDFITQALQPLRSCPILTGNLVQAQKFSPGGTTLVQHGLGRPFVGAIPLIPAFSPIGNASNTIPVSYAYNTLPAGLTSSTHVALYAQSSQLPGSPWQADVWVF
jgi:hypothetical protein